MTKTDLKRPRLLIFSFSRIEVDGRVIRQVKEFVHDFDVVTCGIGGKPHPDVVEHIELTTLISSPMRKMQGILLNLKLNRLTYELDPRVHEARRKLGSQQFDLVIVDDIPTAGALPASIPSSRVLLDLHEYWPGIQDNDPNWVRLRKPHYTWQLRKFGKKASRFTTVNSSLAKLYRENFGFECEVVTNASALREDLEAQPVSTPVRYVHSGVARRARCIDLMMRAVAASTAGATMDLYLMDETTDYYRELKQLEASLGGRVRILPPVPHEELVGLLNRYDVGLTFFPPTTTNIRNGLPNKFFDYAQAKLAIVAGPTPPMVELLEQHDLGVVTPDFSEEALTAAISSLTAEDIARYKANATRASRDLSAVTQVRVWRQMIESMRDSAAASKG